MPISFYPLPHDMSAAHPKHEKSAGVYHQCTARRQDQSFHSVCFIFNWPRKRSIPRLKQWADKFQINPENWDLLTGDKKQFKIWRSIIWNWLWWTAKGWMRILFHSDMFVLIDSSRNIRGYYRGLWWCFIETAFERCGDAYTWKNHNEKNKNTGLIKIMTFVFLIAGVAIGLYLIMFKKKKCWNLQKKMIKKQRRFDLFYFGRLFLMITALGRKTQYRSGFDIRIFALANAVINSPLAILLVLALVAVKGKSICCTRDWSLRRYFYPFYFY